MKKFLSILLSVIVMSSVMASCGNNNTGSESTPNESTPSVADTSSTGDASTASGSTEAVAYVDGTYTVEASDARAEAGHGWKDKLVVVVSSGVPTIKEFESYDKDNNPKSTKEDYGMTVEDNGTVPSEFFPALIESWNKADGDISKVEVVAGATHTSETFVEFMTAALEAAKTGNTEVIVRD